MKANEAPEKYIPKSALVAEIEKMKERFVYLHHKDGIDWPLDNYGKMRAYNEILSILNTIEVKDVDLEMEQRIKECPFRSVACNMYDGMTIECEGRCSWVVDYPKLKELKAQKGE